MDQPGLDQEALDQAVRLHTFRQAAETAHVPGTSEIATALGRSQREVEESLRRLALRRALILAPGTANIWAADPFCGVPSNFRVNALGRTYWGICIWDALGIPAALHADAVITARCGDCDKEIVLTVRDGVLAHSEGLVHIAIPAIRWWDNIAFT